jgi:transcriptional adapter 2-alpha
MRELNLPSGPVLTGKNCVVQMQVADKKRTKEERDVINRLRPFAKLQTAEDFEEFVADTLCTWYREIYLLRIAEQLPDESILRKRIQELQQYRRLGLRTATDVERYHADVEKRVCCHPPFIL